MKSSRFTPRLRHLKAGNSRKNKKDTAATVEKINGSGKPLMLKIFLQQNEASHQFLNTEGGTSGGGRSVGGSLRPRKRSKESTKNSKLIESLCS